MNNYQNHFHQDPFHYCSPGRDLLKDNYLGIELLTGAVNNNNLEFHCQLPVRLCKRKWSCLECWNMFPFPLVLALRNHFQQTRNLALNNEKKEINKNILVQPLAVLTLQTTFCWIGIDAINVHQFIRNCFSFGFFGITCFLFNFGQLNLWYFSNFLRSFGYNIIRTSMVGQHGISGRFSGFLVLIFG